MAYSKTKGRDPDWKLLETYKPYRRVYGEFVYQASTGDLYYFAFRNNKWIYRGGQTNISGAKHQDIAGWAIDYNTLMRCRRMEVDFIGVYVLDTKDQYVAPFEAAFDPEKSIRIDVAGRDSMQRVIFLQHFEKTPGPIKLRG